MFWEELVTLGTSLLFSIIGNEDQISAYELHIGVKDYCFGRENRLIGVSVMQLKDIMDQVSDFLTQMEIFIFGSSSILFYILLTYFPNF